MLLCAHPEAKRPLSKNAASDVQDNRRKSNSMQPRRLPHARAPFIEREAEGHTLFPVTMIFYQS
jgi:hypothetical protein